MKGLWTVKSLTLAGASFVLTSLAILAGGHGGGAAYAQALANHNSNAPVDFDAGSIEVQDRADRVVLAGGVRVTQAGLTVVAPRMTVAYTCPVDPGREPPVGWTARDRPQQRPRDGRWSRCRPRPRRQPGYRRVGRPRQGHLQRTAKKSVTLSVKRRASRARKDGYGDQTHCGAGGRPRNQGVPRCVMSPCCLPAARCSDDVRRRPKSNRSARRARSGNWRKR